MGEIEKLKAQILEEASEKPEKFFPVEKIKENGFKRGKCSNCGKHFWSVDKERDVCGEAECSGGYTFINSSPVGKTLDYTSVWEEFSNFMEGRGYSPVNRYPVLASWRDDTEFVRASIYDFQPYVVSGEVEPPSNPLVIGQPSLRFNDIDNVGITGAHYVMHNHIGQHAFKEAGNYSQDKYFEDILEWLTVGLEIPKEDITIHEDAWGGGGNLGTSMEFFVGGLELLNQVYMFYEVDDSERGYSELNIKVLDMGMGHERIAWISNGSKTSYDAAMPGVLEKLYKKTGVDPDEDIRDKFLPYSGLLNADEVGDIEDKWEEIAEEIGVDEEKLKEEIGETADIYSIADHTRALLVAFVDGALPSNTGEKHSLRVIARRALDIIDKHDWEVDLKEVLEWHAEELENLFPELKQKLGQAKEIMEHEEKKYRQARAKAERIIKNLEEETIGKDKLIELYDTHGISPELLERFHVKVDKPKNFYSEISERHEQSNKEEEEETNFDLKDIQETEKLYIEDEKKVEFDGEVLEILEKNNEKYVVLNRTCFYPTQGGQMNDLGTISGSEVLDVVNQGGIILHKMKEIDFKEGETVEGKIDWERRKQLMQHHTATHVINGAAAEVLGEHISQAGAKKTKDKARLDITHYENLGKEELEKIEEVAKKWIEMDFNVDKTVMKKSEAEKKHGFKIYQGGVPPGNKLRIVNIGQGKDVEACAGTHVDKTSEIEDIVIVKSTKVQDGVVRLEFKSGEAAREYRRIREKTVEELGEIIDMEDYTLEDVAEIFDVPVGKLMGVVERFVEEWKERKERLEELKEFLDRKSPTYSERPRDPEKLFEEWKGQEKNIKKLERAISGKLKEVAGDSKEEFISQEVPVENVGNLIKITKEITSEHGNKSVMIRGKNAVVASNGNKSNYDIRKEVEREAKIVKEEGGILKGFNLK